MKKRYTKFGINVSNELLAGHLPKNNSFYETYYSPAALSLPIF